MEKKEEMKWSRDHRQGFPILPDAPPATARLVCFCRFCGLSPQNRQKHTIKGSRSETDQEHAENWEAL